MKSTIDFLFCKSGYLRCNIHQQYIIDSLLDFSYIASIIAANKERFLHFVEISVVIIIVIKC